MPQIRIKGIVREADALRRALSAPLSASQLNDLSQRVRESVDQVETLMLRHNAGLRHLPTPSRRAFEFLKRFDPNAVPITNGSHPASRFNGGQESIGFRGLRSFLDRLMDNIALATNRDGLNIAAMGQVIRRTRDRLDEQMSTDGIEAGHLKPESRQLLRWFRFFAEPDALQRYVDAVRIARDAFNPPKFRQRGWRLPLIVHFRTSSHLYRCKSERIGTRIVLVTPMIAFEPAMFELLGQQILGSRKHRQLVTEAMLDVGYQSLALEMENCVADADRTVGMVHNLSQSFNRVNTAYFDGAMERPHLSWTRRLTGRVFGHFDFIHDQLCISSTLDHAQVPEFVVDHVMHHELLHKKHGIRWSGNRQCVHTPEFRREERSFIRYDEADQFLTRLSARL